MSVEVVEVFADVSCPFAHVGIARFVLERARRGLELPHLRVRAWPLEIVNGAPLTGEGIAPKVAALRRDVAPDLFAGFRPSAVPTSTLGVLAAEAAAHRQDPAAGERFSLAVRRTLFDVGEDPSDAMVLRALLDDHGLDAPTPVDDEAVRGDHAEGVARGVRGSPHFFVGGTDFFCPSLDIAHDGGGYHIAFDVTGFDRFAAAVFS